MKKDHVEVASRKLYQQYGGTTAVALKDDDDDKKCNATQLHHITMNTTATTTDSLPSSTMSLFRNNVELYNIIGKVLVIQKMKKRNMMKRYYHQQRKQLNDNNGSDDKIIYDDNVEDKILSIMEDTRMKLSLVEQEAHSLIESSFFGRHD